MLEDRILVAEYVHDQTNQVAKWLVILHFDYYWARWAVGEAWSDQSADQINQAWSDQSADQINQDL